MLNSEYNAFLYALSSFAPSLLKAFILFIHFFIITHLFLAIFSFSIFAIYFYLRQFLSLKYLTTYYLILDLKSIINNAIEKIPIIEFNIIIIITAI